MGGMLDSFLGYYRRFFREFGVQLWSTWRTEVWPAMLLAAFIYYLSRQHDLNAKTTFWYTSEAAGIYLAGWAAYHLIRTPWKLSLDTAEGPAISFKEKIFNLSTAILDFIYERSQSSPDWRTPLFPDCANYEAQYPDKSPQEFYTEQTRQQYQAYKAYESDTLGMYNYRFKKGVVEVVNALKNKGISDEILDDLLHNPSGLLYPYNDAIKAIGKQLGELSDQIAE